MDRNTLLVLVLLVAPSAADACRCRKVDKPTDVWPDVAHALPTNPVLVLFLDPDRVRSTRRAVSRSALVSGEHRAPLRIIERYLDGRQLLVRPRRPLLPNRRYHLEGPADADLPDTVWTTAGGPDEAAPRWIQPPALVERYQGADSCGNAGVALSAAVDAAGSLAFEVEVRAVGGARPRTERFIRPVSAPTFALSVGLCRRRGLLSGDGRRAVFLTALDAAGHRVRHDQSIDFTALPVPR